MDADFNDAELIILENIYDSSHKNDSLRQRDLAHIAGTSLGMTNAILKRLAQKGYISIQRLNSRNIKYLVTPEGINEIAQRSYRYFKRTIRNVVFYRDQLEHAVIRAKKKGLHTLVLIGSSDLDFILEHACTRHGLSYLKAVNQETAAPLMDTGVFMVYAEKEKESGCQDANPDKLYISSILTGKKE